MFNIGDKVKVFINDIGYRRCEIVGTGLNSFWIEHKGKRYLIATKILAKWNRK